MPAAPILAVALEQPVAWAVATGKLSICSLCARIPCNQRVIIFARPDSWRGWSKAQDALWRELTPDPELSPSEFEIGDCEYIGSVDLVGPFSRDDAQAMLRAPRQATAVQRRCDDMAMSTWNYFCANAKPFDRFVFVDREDQSGIFAAPHEAAVAAGMVLEGSAV